MEIFLLGLVAIGVFICIFSCMMLIRNNRVYKHRMRILDKIYYTRLKELREWGTYVKLGEMSPSSEPRYSLDFDVMNEVDYDYVLNHFWRLDFDSFYPEEYRVGSKNPTSKM